MYSGTYIPFKINGNENYSQLSAPLSDRIPVRILSNTRTPGFPTLVTLGDYVGNALYSGFYTAL